MAEKSSHYHWYCPGRSCMVDEAWFRKHEGAPWSPDRCPHRPPAGKDLEEGEVFNEEAEDVGITIEIPETISQQRPDKQKEM